MVSSPSVIRVVDLETTGSRPGIHGVCEIGWQDVVQGADGRWELGGERAALLVNPGRDIPAVTAAVHHIVDADVAQAPSFEEVAPGVLAPGGRPFTALAAHRSGFEQRWCAPEYTRGASWICTWKCALRLWPESPSHSNQVLRYWRKPVGLDRDLGLPVHRAGPDAYVTAHHLRDMLNEASLSQLLEWTRQPALLARVPVGPKRGKRWHELDDLSLQRIATGDHDEDVIYTARAEQALRAGQPAQPQARLL